MRTALEFYDTSTFELKVLTRHIAVWLDEIPDRVADTPFTEDNLWSCHTIVRAVKQVFNLRDWQVVDGFFQRKGTQHAWLRQKKLVLDVYPVASLGAPIVVDAAAMMSPWRDLYIEAPVGYYPGWRIDHFELHTNELLRATTNRFLEMLTSLP